MSLFEKSRLPVINYIQCCCFATKRHVLLIVCVCQRVLKAPFPSLFLPFNEMRKSSQYLKPEFVLPSALVLINFLWNNLHLFEKWVEQRWLVICKWRKWFANEEGEREREAISSIVDHGRRSVDDHARTLPIRPCLPLRKETQVVSGLWSLWIDLWSLVLICLLLTVAPILIFDLWLLVHLNWSLQLHDA